MLRSCKAGSLVQVQVRAPIRSLSSFGRAPTWYVGGGRIEACREHHAPVAQLVGGISLRTRAVRVRISPGAPFFARVAQSEEDAGKCRFEACRGYAPVAQSAEAAASRAACCRFESCAAHQLDAPFAKRQRHLAYTQTFGGSSPSGSTTPESPSPARATRRISSMLCC
jgi:hypothetical protein